MIGVRRALLFLVALCVVGFACVATANMIQNRPPRETVFDNSGQPWPFFSQVAAINYDNGGQGVGYNVPTPNPGSCPDGASYRPDAVNFKTSIAGAPAIPFQIGCSQSPNSFNYTINISQSGPYEITLQLADNSAGGAWNILLDGVIVTSVTVPNTGPGFDTFATSTSGPFSASLGNHKLTLAWGAGDANFGGVGDILTWQGSQAPATAINSVSMDCGNACGFTGGVAGTVGHAQAVMSSGSFAGTWSPRTSGTDNFGVTCKNWTGSLAISSGGTVTNGAIANGTYDGFCIVATQGGAGGSPFAQAVTITGSSAGVTPPAVAAAAGFTTLARNDDYSLPFYATQSNYLDCSGVDTSTRWHWKETEFPCSSISQGSDPVTNDTVLNMFYQQSYNNIPAGFHFLTMQTLNEPANSQVTDYGNGYYEVIIRQDVNLANGGPNSYWAWNTNSVWPGGNEPSVLEPDFVELYGNGGFPFGDGTVVNHAGGGANLRKTWWSNDGCCNVNIPAGWTTTVYHKYGMLITSNGSSNIEACGFIDDSLQSCVDTLAASTNYPDRYFLKLWCGNNGDEHCYVKYTRVWSCAAWNTQGNPPYTNPAAAAQCNGSSLFNSGGLTYWHN